MNDVKKGKSMTMGWKDIIPEALQGVPKGYSTAEEIGISRNMHRSTVSELLKRLREDGKIKCMQVKGERGKTIWVYKD